MSAIRLLQILALAGGASAFAPYAGPDLESFEFVYQVPDGPALRIVGSKPRGRDAQGKKFDCIQPGSGAGYYVVPAGESPSLFGPPETATPHNSFSNPIDGFFAPGGTKVWQADAAFEWLLGAAFGL